MNSLIKAEWIAALRSGKYKQGRQRLRNKHDEFCCLGVLCDLIEPTEWQSEDGAFLNDGHASFPGEQVLRKSDLLEFAYPVPPILGPLWDLAYANDDGKTFEEIAEMIERTL